MPPPELRRTSPRFHPQQSDAEARRHGHQGLPAATLLPGAPRTGAECGQHGGPLGSLPLERQQLERVPPGGEAAELDGGDGVCSERDGMLYPGDVAFFQWYFADRQNFDDIFRIR